MSLENRSVALVEDDPIMGGSLVQRLELEGARVAWWRTGTEAVNRLAGESPDAVICDIRLPDITGDEVFRHLCRDRRPPPFLFITAHGDIAQAVRLMREGASDYLTKPFEMAQFLERLTHLIGAADDAGETVLGVSAPMRDVEAFLRRAARVNSNLLITGETGVGKEVCARFLHGLHEETSRPFMAVNCAAIPRELMESELFGHEKGAFTGAHARHVGYAERTAQGTLFLDEVAELPLGLQAKLLRLIEQRSFHRVGGEKVVPFKGRLVCATNADVAERVKQGQFREDLFYRINVLSLNVPPLRERADDVEWLLDRSLDEFSQQNPTEAVGFSSLAVEAARSHRWPGNVRELRNRVERAVALATGRWILPSDLFPDSAGPALHGDAIVPLGTARDDAERRHIQRALAATDGALQPAARMLGISRTTLWEKMRRHGLSCDDA